MTATAALCHTNNVFCQHVSTLAQPSLPASFLRSNGSIIRSASSTTMNYLTLDSTDPIDFKITSDENNNHQSFSKEDGYDVLYITSDDDDDDIIYSFEEESTDHQQDIQLSSVELNLDPEKFLSFVGLRSKNQRTFKTASKMGSLTKRWANPVCLLPLPKYAHRVRPALYIMLPFLKFLKITHNIEYFCATDASARAQSLLPRSRHSIGQSKKHLVKRKSNGTDSMKYSTHTRRSHSLKDRSVGECFHSILECHVSLDRLDQSTIDQIMKNSEELCSEDVDTSMSIRADEISTRLCPKRKSTADEQMPLKRLKTGDIDQTTMENDDEISSMYKRIYLKCFVCSKRNYIDGQALDSHILHSHWLEHDGNLTLNIYDSEIDSILTRVVEFFHSPKRHTLEGKLKMIFVLNSQEIHRLPTTRRSSSNQCIVID